MATSEIDFPQGALSETLEVFAPHPARSPDALISAQNDTEAVEQFLSEYRDSSNTFRAYRKEAERFMLWCLYQRGKGLAEIKREDIEALFDFYRNPPADWIEPKAYKRGDERWRPFKGPVSEQSLHQARLVLHSMFDYLVDARYLPANPMSLIRRKQRNQSLARSLQQQRARKRHGLGRERIERIFEHLRAMPEDDKKTKFRKLRNQLTFALFFYTGGRLNEIMSATTDNLECGENRWWLHVIGKGFKPASLPLPYPVIEALAHMRELHQLPRLPMSAESRPLICRQGNPDKGISASMGYKMLKELFRDVANELEREEDFHGAQIMRKASTHWLRHSAIGFVVDQTSDLRLAKRMGRHESIDTTAAYATAEEEQFHDQLCEVFERAGY